MYMSLYITLLVCVVRYLLKKEVNVLLKNNAGDLPIHLACQYAQQGHKHGKSLQRKLFVLVFRCILIICSVVLCVHMTCMRFLQNILYNVQFQYKLNAA